MMTLLFRKYSSLLPAWISYQTNGGIASDLKRHWNFTLLFIIRSWFLLYVNDRYLICIVYIYRYGIFIDLVSPSLYSLQEEAQPQTLDWSHLCFAIEHHRQFMRIDEQLNMYIHTKFQLCPGTYVIPVSQDRYFIFSPAICISRITPRQVNGKYRFYNRAWAEWRPQIRAWWAK